MYKKLSGGARRKLNAEKVQKQQEVLEKVPKINIFFAQKQDNESDEAKSSSNIVER